MRENDEQTLASHCCVSLLATLPALKHSHEVNSTGCKRAGTSCALLHSFSLQAVARHIHTNTVLKLSAHTPAIDALACPAAACPQLKECTQGLAHTPACPCLVKSPAHQERDPTRHTAAKPQRGGAVCEPPPPPPPPPRGAPRPPLTGSGCRSPSRAGPVWQWSPGSTLQDDPGHRYPELQCTSNRIAVNTRQSPPTQHASRTEPRLHWLARCRHLMKYLVVQATSALCICDFVPKLSWP